MDDGLQNPTLQKSAAFLVIDGGQGFGNGHLLPAGPLREPIAAAAMRCAAAVLIGPDVTAASASLPPELPLLRANLIPSCASLSVGQPVIAFAGIGRPEKFFASAAALGLVIRQAIALPDHHVYHAWDEKNLIAAAAAHNAQLVTTEKDAVKLSPELRARCHIITVALAWEDEAALRALLDAVMTSHADKSGR
jgi:tetraacyldisaccharide 4'-kinase